jgi:phage terminase large subunit-like protein
LSFAPRAKSLILQSWGAASWTDPEVWRKANPSFGLSVKADDLARKAEKAIALPGAQNAFRRMHLNEWTEQAERWIDIAAWDACAGHRRLRRDPDPRRDGHVRAAGERGRKPALRRSACAER